MLLALLLKKTKMRTCINYNLYHRKINFTHKSLSNMLAYCLLVPFFKTDRGEFNLLFDNRREVQKEQPHQQKGPRPQKGPHLQKGPWHLQREPQQPLQQRVRPQPRQKVHQRRHLQKGLQHPLRPLKGPRRRPLHQHQLKHLHQHLRLRL